MRIAIDARFWGLEHTGLGRYTISLVKSLSKIDSKNEYFVLLRKKYFDKSKFPENFTKINADFRHYGVVEQLQLPRIIKALDVDITHYLHFNVPIFAKKPFVVTIHDLTMHRHNKATHLPLPLYLIKRAAYKSVFKNAVNNSSKIIVPTKAVKDDLLEQYSIADSKFVPIPEGFDEVFIKEKGDLDTIKKYSLQKNYFIYVGNTYPHKNIRRLIEATYLVNKREKRKVQLVIVSANDKFTMDLKEDLSEFGAENIVKFLKGVSDLDLVGLYKNSVALVYPSMAEGFGLQGLEAMAAGTLVLASDINVFKEVYGKNAIYFNPHDFTSIGKAMQDAISLNSNKRKKKLKEAGDYIEKYSWDKMAVKTVKVYEEVAKS